MPYRIKWKPSALREFKKLPADLQSTVRTAVESLAENPRPAGCRKLAGTDHAYRLRLGDYRLVYEVEDRHVRVYVLRIRPRGDVYRNT